MKGKVIKMKNMTWKTIKETMKQLYISHIESNETDSSYNDLWQALRTLKSLNLISEELWKKIYEYDHYLFNNIDQIMEEERK